MGHRSRTRTAVAVQTSGMKLSIRYDSERHQYFTEPLDHVVNAYNFAKHLKTLHELTPDAHIIACGQKDPEWFHTNPRHHPVGLNT